MRYALTLELRGAGDGVVNGADRSCRGRLRRGTPRPGLSAVGEVEVPDVVGIGLFALLTLVTPTNGGTVRRFHEGGFGSAGGAPATITLSKPATVLFQADGMELSLTLTATSAGGAVTTTTRIVSSARGFDGLGLSTLFATPALAAGMEVFAAADASLTIWHNNDQESYALKGPNANLFTVGRDGAVSVKGSLPSSPDEALRYALTLELSGGGTVSERSLLLELQPPRPGLSAVGEVEVPALSGSGYALLTVTPTNGGTVRGFVNESGFGSAGGAPATITLSKPATVLFQADGMELSLTLTATSAGGAVTTTTRIVSSARGFDGLGLSTLFATTALAAGMEVFAATDASLTIWHNTDQETYTLKGPNAALFTVGADGAVSVKGSLPSSPDEALRYALTLELRGGGTVSERSLLLELQPPRPGLSAVGEVEVPALSGSGYALLTVTPTNGGTVRRFNESGFGSAGGTPAVITLSKPATMLFKADGMELSLTLTATSAGGAVTTTTRIVSSARGFDGLGLSTLFATPALAAGMEVFAAADASLTIWHNTDQETYTLKGPNAALFTVGADGAVSVKGSLPSSPDEALRYALTLELRGGGTVSERSLLLELQPPRPGLSAVGEVEVPALSGSGYALLTVTPTNGGTVRRFHEGGFGSAGGAPATITLSKPATVLFQADGMELSLTLTATSAGGAVTTTTRVVSSARGFDGLGLSTLFATPALAAGMEVFAASVASLTIWHAFGGEKRYELLGTNAALFTVGRDGAVSVKGSLPSSPDEVLVYALTLELSGGGTVSERSLLLELQPPRPGLSAVGEVEVPALSGSGYALLTVTPTNGGTVREFNAGGFGSEGGTPATITLSKPATMLFKADGMELSLTLTATSAGGAVTATTRVVSSARGFDGLGLSTLFATTALDAGTEVFAASAASLTIWHNTDRESYTLKGPNAALFTVGADGAVSVKGSLPSSPDEALRYALTLELRGGGTVSERSLLLELQPPRPGLSAVGEVEVPALSGSGYALLTVTPTNGGTVRRFNESGFGSAGGAPAVITLSKPATMLFKADGMELSLTLTATSAGGAVTTTTRIVSSARGFDGLGLSTLFATPALAAGMEVFAAADASLTIWHNTDQETYTLKGPNAALFTVGADGAVSVKGSLPSSPDEALRYALTLELRGGGTVSERSLLLELQPPRPGLSAVGEVEVPALSGSGYALLTVTPTNGGTVRRFHEGGFGSAGGAPATITLSKPATVLFQADGMELSLTLTATSAGGAATTTTRIVSSARGFDGLGLSTLFATPALAADMEVFAAADASLTIWHNTDQETYTLKGPNAALFTVGADGAVSVKGSLPSSPDEALRYALTLELSGGGTVSERSLLLELQPPRPGLSAVGEVEVPALSGSGYALLTVTPTNGGTVRRFNEGGFGSAGGAPATITLSKPATVLFQADGMELSLTLTATSAGGAVTTTTRVVSSARGFDGLGLSTLFATPALAAGMEVFAASVASLTIWHAFGGEKRYELLGTNAALFTVGRDGAVSVKGSLPSSPDEVLVYALTLELSGGGTVSERSLLLELQPPRPGLSAVGEVEVPALSGSGYALLTVTPTNGGTVREFNAGGFGSEGGTPAVITLSKPATMLFKADGMELSLTLTATSAGGAVTTTTRVVSSARGFDGLGLSTLFATTALDAGTEVFAASAASLTIWHNTDQETYTLKGPNAALFTVGADGAVSVKGSLPSSPDEALRYALTLELRGGGTVSERSLLLELQPPRPGLSAVGEVEVPALSGSGYALLTVTPTNGGTVRRFNESGFGSAGGTPAVITLSKPATMLFKADGMELSLTLTATSAGGAVTTTTRIVSSARGFDGLGLSTLFATPALAAGMEVFAAADASLTIWHNNDQESYALKGPNANLFTVGRDGAVSVKESLPSSPDEVLVYGLTLELKGGGTVSERLLLLELRPPRPGLSAVGEVEVPALSGSGYALLTVTPTNGGTVRGFVNESGFGSAGGAPATITLSPDEARR